MIHFIYLIILLSLLLIEYKSRVLSSFCRILIPLIFTLFIGLRGYDIGFDTSHYTEIFYSIAPWGDGYLEFGYEWLQHFIYKIGRQTSLERIWVESTYIRKIGRASCRERV